ncbi:MAG: efflux RND transporter periplasmic adaptor subunit [Gammaproteobacteria bacterium]|nr:efflux RND transporter periplasmic adaptor subunit [Gammaproteobacteria bacterium]MCW5582882.1 efflux RND transporter periplasmic adaptor subunit [Gammaproteobacteria bacterium]
MSNRWRFKLVHIMIGLAIMVMLGLQTCSHEPKSSDGQLVKVEAKPFSNTLYYSGIIQPLKTLVVPSPVDGVIIDMPFQYGEPVKTGQLLFKISSTKFLTDYKSALMQYIKTKSDFNNSQAQLSEANFLHKNQLISDDDFKMRQSNYYAAQLALLQAKDTLENLLHQLNIQNINPYTLTISDVDKITQAMHLKTSSENLPIYAPANGIILSSNKNEDENKKTIKGDNIKQGDILAVIGDMKGISVKIKVNELTINQLKLGQEVKVTGIAFPDDILNGKITRIDRQGEASSGGLPTFNVEVNVSELSGAQQKIIHAGMSAKVEVHIKEETQIVVPLASVKEKNGRSFVLAYDEKTRKKKMVEVKTGKTTVDSVTILSGLKMGDNIVVPN